MPEVNRCNAPQPNNYRAIEIKLGSNESTSSAQVGLSDVSRLFALPNLPVLT